MAKKKASNKKKLRLARKSGPVKKKSNPEFVVFFTTFSSRDVADHFARLLVTNRYAACVNVISNISSHYIWKDQQVSESEFLLLGKTNSKAFQRLKADIKDLHPYELPELIALPIVDGLPEYLTWLG